MAAENPTIDAVIARMLASLPAFRGWSNTPLDRQTLQLINTADTQTLMSIAALTLRRIASPTTTSEPT